MNKDKERERLLNDVFGEEAQPKKQYRMRLRTAFIVAGFLFFFGVIMGSAVGQPGSVEPSAPAPTVTVTATHTTTQNRLPASCARALTIMERMMDASAIIASAGEKQLDLAHAARQAIFMKDWKMLDEVMNKQTELNNSLDTPSHDALSIALELKQTMKECRDELD